MDCLHSPTFANLTLGVPRAAPLSSRPGAAIELPWPLNGVVEAYQATSRANVNSTISRHLTHSLLEGGIESQHILHSNL